jgi:hypothetical protein
MSSRFPHWQAVLVVAVWCALLEAICHLSGEFLERPAGCLNTPLPFFSPPPSPFLPPSSPLPPELTRDREGRGGTRLKWYGNSALLRNQVEVVLIIACGTQFTMVKPVTHMLADPARESIRPLCPAAKRYQARVQSPHKGATQPDQDLAGQGALWSPTTAMTDDRA